MAICINACDRENPCDASCDNGECVLSVDSVATTPDVTIQISDTLTVPFRIDSSAGIGTVEYQNQVFPLANSLFIAPNVEISKTSNIPNSTAVFSLLTFPACDCFTGWDGMRCDEPAPCELIECKNDGIAKVNVDSCYCECTPGFMGTLCAEIDPCFSINCRNNSHCEVNEETGETECVCDIGYETPFCVEKIRAKFLGAYTMVLDSCSTRDTIFNVPQSALPYSLNIKEDDDTTKIEQIVLDSTSTFGIIKAKVTIDDSLFVNEVSEEYTIQSHEGIFNRATKTIDLSLIITTNANSAKDSCYLRMIAE